MSIDDGLDRRKFPASISWVKMVNRGGKASMDA